VEGEARKGLHLRGRGDDQLGALRQQGADGVRRGGLGKHGHHLHFPGPAPGQEVLHKDAALGHEAGAARVVALAREAEVLEKGPGVGKAHGFIIAVPREGPSWSRIKG